MNRELSFTPCEAGALYDLAREDIARNYFICYTIDNGQAYENAWQIDQNVGVFLRKTGLVQIAIRPGIKVETYSAPLRELMAKVQWKQAIVPESVMRVLVDLDQSMPVAKAAIISACRPMDFIASKRIVPALKFEKLTEAHLDRVVQIYEGVFKSFAKKDYMTRKIEANRGRGVVAIQDGEMVAVAQTDYESREAALVVGVATQLHHQGRGYGRAVMVQLCTQLVSEGKTLYLQYDSPTAGKLYDSLGFKQIEQNYYVSNIKNDR